MIVIVLTSMIESTGVYFALADLTGRKLSAHDMANGYRAEGLGVILSGIFNTFPIQPSVKTLVWLDFQA